MLNNSEYEPAQMKKGTEPFMPGRQQSEISDYSLKEKRGRGMQKIFEEIIAKMFPNFMKPKRFLLRE